MDFIDTLSDTLGIDATGAKALAGAVLGAAHEQVPDEETARIDATIPELGEWKSMAEGLLGGDAEEDSAGGLLGGLAKLAGGAGDDDDGGMLGSLAQLAGGGAGNDLLGSIFGSQAQETATLVALLDKLGLEPSQAVVAAGPILTFLKDRVGAEWLDRIVGAAPTLMGLAQAAQSGGEAPDAGDLVQGLLKGLIDRD